MSFRLDLDKEGPGSGMSWSNGLLRTGAGLSSDLVIGRSYKAVKSLTFLFRSRL